MKKKTSKKPHKKPKPRSKPKPKKTTKRKQPKTRAKRGMGRSAGVLPALKRHYESAKDRARQFYNDNERAIRTAAKIALGVVGAGALGYGAYRTAKDPRVAKLAGNLSDMISNRFTRSQRTLNADRPDTFDYPTAATDIFVRPSAIPSESPDYRQFALNAQTRLENQKKLSVARKLLASLRDKLRHSSTGLQEMKQISALAQSEVDELDNMGELSDPSQEDWRRNLIADLNQHVLIRA